MRLSLLSLAQFDKLVEVQSDKATVEITSPFAGKIESLAYEVGATAKVGTPLLHWIAAGGASDAPAAGKPAAAAPAAASKAAPAAAAPAVASSGKALATPATRALAREHQIDLAKLTGTGRDGRVTKEDILNYISSGGAAAAPAAAAPAAAAPAAAPAAAAAPIMAPPPRVASGGGIADETEPIRGIRKAMFAQVCDC